MAGYIAEFDLRFQGEVATDDVIDLLDEVVNQLQAHGGRHVAALANESDRSVSITLAVASKDPAAAFTEAYSIIRSAFQAAGVGTPGWEQFFQEGASRIEPTDLAPA